jgi:hypothetical protein
MRKGIKFGIIGVVVTIIGLRAFYLASPLFISTEINEPPPEGANESAPLSSNQFQEFLVMSEEKRTEAGSQMNDQEKTYA